jgi:hypothetical protein
MTDPIVVVNVRTPASSTTLGFIDSTLDHILERPGLWGSLHSVELQVIRLLEVRFVLAGGDTHESGLITRSFLDYLNENFPDASPRSMWGRIEETNPSMNEEQREYVFRRVLRVFIEEVKREQDAFTPMTLGPRKPEYHPNDDDSRLSYLMEECAEVIHIGCKVQRFGWLGANPELPPEEQKTNVQLMLHELGNASYAIDLMYRQLGARLPIPEE